jgi:Holliday junction resolvase RusA-like endonuclease
VQAVAYSAMNGREPMTGELSAVVKLYRRYKTTARIFGDVDNHLKALFDGLNGIVFADDSQIVQCKVSKHTDKKNPRAEIEIRKVDESQ